MCISIMGKGTIYIYVFLSFLNCIKLLSYFSCLSYFHISMLEASEQVLVMQLAYYSHYFVANG